MNTRLTDLEIQHRIKLPRRPWGGSFSGMDTLHTGDLNALVFLRADGGDGESDKRNIILFAQHQNNVVTARINLLDDKLDKSALLAALNGEANVGPTIAALFNTTFEI